jgi:hypothetical protein
MRTRTSWAERPLIVTGRAICARNWFLSTSDPSGFEHKKSSARISSNRRIAMLHRVDVVAVECGQFIKVAACGSFGLHGRLIERQSHGPISRSVLTLSPSPAASKVTAIRGQRSRSADLAWRAQLISIVPDLATRWSWSRWVGILWGVGTRHESPANGPSMAGYDRGFRWGS